MQHLSSEEYWGMGGRPIYCSYLRRGVWPNALTLSASVGWLGGFLVGIAIAILPIPSSNAASAANAQPAKAEKKTQPQFIRPRVTCPTNAKDLTEPLLRDLPAYMNRVYLRIVHRKTGGLVYAIAASQPNFVPLPAESSEYNNPVDNNLQQIFFTVLERQYVGQQVTEFQHYHWLFLAKTTDGWRIALMYSRLGFYPDKEKPVTPPRESNLSLTAQAIKLWLRDCRAGAVRLTENRKTETSK